MTRLDAELVRRGLARSRRRAAELVEAGRVLVDGSPAAKPARAVAPTAELTVAPGDEYVSRGAHKLLGAFDDLAALGTPVVVASARCLDAGASTGGFTQVLLEAGAAHVDAVDVGHGQAAPEIAADPRVTVREGVNVRHLVPADLTGPPDLVVADLSFISLTLVLDALIGVTAPGAHLLVLVKPQFEVGRERLGADGVVTSDALRAEAVLAVADAVPQHVRIDAVLPSRLPGPAGNREYFLHLVVTDDASRDPRDQLVAAVDAAVAGRAALVRPMRTPRRDS
ncbi:TlyA family RNA methyltransferase [Actinotalea sp. M2MS4P-6]|uniref:TlyA family RNA methyltransferase n=1 Tax=Actinotalea sp. M2MS4P-6 TaxID=2983762 RepID=UPI0021E38439|nr:TlyA family RNA methyltransferase [Actinotalea sp. M2MS4P-6]MCV2393368.1 TlyA family RNA methyltransferase [Actinotalea sp. M2MS4P-6]